MGQAVKYALLAASLLLVIGMCVVYIGQIPVSATVSAFASSVTSIISVCGDLFKSARGLLNALVGVPQLVTMCLWFTLLMPFAKWGIQLAVTVYKWINQ